MITFLACLADGSVIESSYRIACYGSLVAAAVALLLCVIEWRRGTFQWWAVYAVVVLVHPGWTLWPIYRTGMLEVSSDCGYSDRFFSVAVVVVLIGTLAIRVLRPDFRLRLFLLVLAGTSWWVYFAVSIYWHRGMIPWTLPPNAFLAIIFSSEPVIVFTTADGATLLRYSLVLSVAALLLHRPWQRQSHKAV
jgi:hypothetical protein